MTTIRTFIAIDLPPDVRAALADVAATLGERVPRLSLIHISEPTRPY